MLEYPSKGGGSNQTVHDAQVALLRFEATHPRDSEAHHGHLHHVPGRRYALGARSMQDIRDRVEAAVTHELEDHAGLTVEHIAHFAALATERAIQQVGVERAL